MSCSKAVSGSPAKDTKSDDPDEENHKNEAEKEEEMNASRAFEILLRRSGDLGAFQWMLWFVIGSIGFFTGFHNISAVFLGATPDHWCKIPYFDAQNVTVQKSWLNFTAPWTLGKEKNLENSKCRYYDYNYSALVPEYSGDESAPDFFSRLGNPSNVHEKKCSSWVFDHSIYKTTVVTEWDLVCDERWMMSSIQASFMMGILTGALIFSIISDKFGRRPSMLLSCVLFFASSVAAAFSTSFTMFLVLRFIVAGAGQGMFLVGFVLLMEVVSLKGRNLIGNSFHSFFAIGTGLLCLAAYFIRDWRNLQLVGSVTIAVLFIQYWLVPESPRWLLMQGREEEGVKLLRKIAKQNSKTFPSDQEIKPLLAVIAKEVESKPNITTKEKLKSVFSSMATLVRTPNMRRRNLIMCYGWLVTSLIYYGLTFSGSNLNASLYLSVSMSGLIELPAAVVVILMLFKYERRTVLALCFISGGLACMAILFVPTEMVWLNLALATFGKFTAAGDFMLVFMLSAELVPTDVRNIAMGVASMCARIGSGIAPYVVDLLGDVYYAIPSTIFGTCSILAGLLCFLLPNVGKNRLPESIAEIEAMPR